VGDARALADAMGAVVGGRLPVYEPDPLVPWDEHLREVRAIQCGAAGQELQPRPARALARQGA
jgi:hypothetical protein